jgi:uncharacterized protein (TIGR02996 family)
MTERDALLAGVLAEPEEDTPRLVYADWLEENDDAERGEFIRIEVELARTPPGTDEAERRRSALHNRRTQLLKKRRQEWLQPFLPHAREPEFERGFVHSLATSAFSFLQHAERWLAITPLRRVKFTTYTLMDEPVERRMAWTALLFESSQLARLREIDLTSCGLTTDDVLLFSRCPHLHQLKELHLPWNQIGTDGAIAIASMPQLKSLESLNLVGNGISDPGVRAIAHSCYLENLQELRISRNPVKKRSWTMLELRFGQTLVG